MISQQILDSIDNPIYWKDLDGKYIGCNKKQAELYGKESVNEVIGKTDFELLDFETANNFRENDKKVLETNQTLYEEEVLNIQPTNEERIFLAKKSPLINEKGEVYGIIGISTDITERKLIENDIKNRYIDSKTYLQQIIDNVDALIYWKDEGGRYLGCNKSLLSTYGLNDISKILGKKDEEIINEDLASKLRENDYLVMQTKKSIDREEQLELEPGNLIDLLAKKSPLIDNNGNIKGIIGVSIDITDRKKLEEKIKHKNEELKKKDKIKTEFIENFSHDVKVPINALVGRTQLLKIISAKDKNEKLAKVAKDVEDSSMILNTLFSQMRDIVIHEQFDNKLYNTKFNLSSLIEKEIEIAKASVPNHKNINIDFHSEDDLSFKVNTDHYKLSQIVRNLLSNAIKFTDEGNVSVETETIRNTDNQVSFKLIVADTGIGIDEAHQNNIFELFNRANITSHNNNRHGMGLGLYIVKNNLNILGGSISFESYLGQGSNFSVKIPLETV